MTANFILQIVLNAIAKLARDLKILFAKLWLMGIVENALNTTEKVIFLKMPTANGYRTVLNVELNKSTRDQIMPKVVISRGGYALNAEILQSLRPSVTKIGCITNIKDQQRIEVLIGKLISKNLLGATTANVPLPVGN